MMQQNETPLPCGGLRVNGVDLSPRTVEQLRQLGASLALYSRMELEAAKTHGADGTLIEDHNGIDFFDKLTLTDDEREEQQCQILGFEPRAVAILSRNGAFGFVARQELREETPYLHSAAYC